MPNKKNYSKKKTNNFSLKKFSNLKQWQKIAVFVLLFGAVGAALLFKSFAATPSYVKGYMTWNGSGGGIYSPTVISSDGWLKAASDFNTFGLPHLPFQYHMYVEEYQNNQWVQVRTSSEFQANGNLDAQCFADKIFSGHIYRVKYDPEITATMHGNYWVRGAHTSGGTNC